MATQSMNTMDNNGKLRELINDWAVAVRSKDVERVMAHYTSDVVAFDVVNPLKYKGSDLVRERLTGWLSSFQGAIGFEISNLEVEAGDSLLSKDRRPLEDQAFTFFGSL